MSGGLQVFPSMWTGHSYNGFQGNSFSQLYGTAFPTFQNIFDEFDIDGPGTPGKGFPGLNLPGQSKLFGYGGSYAGASLAFSQMWGSFLDWLFRTIGGGGGGGGGGGYYGAGNNYYARYSAPSGGSGGYSGGNDYTPPVYAPPVSQKTTAPPQMGSGTQFTSEELIQHFMSKGFTRAGAIGIVANLQAESGLRTDGPTGGQGEEGLAQWKGPRLEKLKQYAAAHGLDWRSKDAQLGYLDEELANDYPGVYSQLKTATDPAEAAQIFCAGFEIPTMDDGTPNYATYATRRQIAAQLAGGG